ncbi:adenylosuccinate synthase [Candidatus Woesearchaeota archaeon]|nr:adenylosuccinate synthase [Candidatus Woesearchaeota archaeon]
MANVMVVGAQWGDEGKGKLIDYLASDLSGYSISVAVRAQGGNNAGHTYFTEDGREIITHLVPSAMSTPHVIGVMGNGMVIDLEVLVEELGFLRDQGVSFDERLWISDRAHAIMPYDKHLDGQRDKTQKIGTTGRGIGPTYGDKILRQGVRMCNFRDGRAHHLIEANIERYSLEEMFDPTEIHEILVDNFSRIEKYICNITEKMSQLMSEGRSFLFEGAQGTMLDIDHGTYPAVTSSNSTVGGLITGSGARPMIDEVWGVVKAYTTRVGNGPFPTELGGRDSELYCAEEGGNKYTKKVEESEYSDLDAMMKNGNDLEKGIALRMLGGEYGATTGRPRRTGWIDIPQLRHAVAVNGMTHIALTKLDVLSGLPKVGMCTGYKRKTGDKWEHYNFPPSSQVHIKEVEPVIEYLPGWGDIKEVRRFKDLPMEAQMYINTIEQRLGVPVKLIGNGKERQQVIIKPYNK